MPQLVVPDNPTIATHRQKQGEAARALNARYPQLADNYGTTIVPARVRKPYDYLEESVIPNGRGASLVGAVSGSDLSG